MMEVAGDPSLHREISCVQVLDGRKQRFEGPEKVVLADLLEFIKVHDPDVILFPYADTWVPLIVKKARRNGLELTFKCTGWFKSMASKSYWSYGLIEFIGAVPSTLSPPDFDKEICRLSLEALSYIPRLLVSYFIGIDKAAHKGLSSEDFKVLLWPLTIT